MDDTATVRLRNPNWKWAKPLVGFAEAVNIVQPSDFDDEPTIPWGLCRGDGIESAEALVVKEAFLVGEQDIIDELTDEDVDRFIDEMNLDYNIQSAVREVDEAISIRQLVVEYLNG